jgi:3-hydroxybutyryl-CoA dehydrogenase
MQKIAVLGAGTMGAGIAQAFAAAGLMVVLRDVSEDLVSGGLNIVRKNLDRQVAKGTLPEIEHQAILGRIQAATALEAVADCDLIVEAIIESMAIKKVVFGELDAICQPSTLFVSNTSSLSITEIASATNRPAQVMGMHFFNPAPVMKLVELIRGIATSQETVDAVHAVALKIGKQPVEVAEAPGFVVNRILVPMINEAVGILAEGIASAQDIAYLAR